MSIKKYSDFDAAVSDMPAAVAGNFDPQSHRTLGDLAWIAQHEMDMFNEGEETDIKSQAEYQRVFQYRNNCLASEARKLSKPIPNETLGYLKKLPGGKIVARHRWQAGYQDLVFPTREAFESAKAKLEST